MTSRTTGSGRRRAGWLLLLLAAAVPGHAQELIAPEPDRDYAVGAGDILGILVPRYTEVSGQYPVERDGTISLQLVPNLVVEGLTPPEIERLLLTRLAEFFTQVEAVHVRVLAKRMIVRVSGFVSTPGEMSVPRDATVQQVVYQAGMQPGTVLTDIRLRRHTGEWVEEIIVDLKAYQEGRGELPPLQSGDELFLRAIETPDDLAGGPGGAAYAGLPVAGGAGSRGRAVQVLGAVGLQGDIGVRDGSSLLDVLLRAQYLPEADLSRVSILRGGQGEPEIFNLQSYLDEGTPPPPLVYPGDVVRVPSKISGTRQVIIRGMVGRSGPLTIVDDMNLQDVILNAGGVQPGGDLTRVLITRTVDGRPVTLEADVQRYMETGDASLLPELQHGDVVHVPRGTLPVDLPGAFVTVQGAVTAPGPQALPARRALPGVLASAGALPTADTSRVRITHTDGESAPGEEIVFFDLEAYEEGSGAPLPELRDGDIIRVEPRTVSVFGAVVNQGEVEIPRDTNVVEAMAMAGGPVPSANLRNIRILRAGGTEGFQEAVTVNLEAYHDSPETQPPLPRVQAGDRIVVAHGMQEDHLVHVFGAVGSPGPIEIPGREASIVHIIQLAGNIDPLQGDEHRVRIVRQGPDGVTVSFVDFGAIIRGQDAGPVPVVRPGDIVRVDPLIESQNGILLFGAFSRQGWIPYQGPGMTLQDVFEVSQASPTAALDRIRILRLEGDRVETHNINDYMERGRPWPEVYPGDVVAIDQRRQGTDIFSEILRIFGIARFFGLGRL